MNKLMSLQDTVKKFIKEGKSMSFGGISCREPMAVTHEIIRQKIKNLTFITGVTTDTVNILLGAGCLNKLEMAYAWIGIVGSGLNLRRAVEQSIPNYVEVEEYSNYAASLRFLAGAMDVPFIPTRSMLGSDLIVNNEKVKVIDCPFTNEKLALVPAARPDVAVIHVQKADRQGNCQIWGVTANDINIARAADKLIITCEEVISTEEIRRIPNMTAIPFYCVDAVVHLPFGSHPLPVAGCYWNDIPFRREFMQFNQTQTGFEEWINQWVFGVKDHAEYLEKVGSERLKKLQDMEIKHYTLPEFRVKGGSTR